MSGGEPPSSMSLPSPQKSDEPSAAAAASAAKSVTDTSAAVDAIAATTSALAGANETHPAASPSTGTPSSVEGANDLLVQYVVVRRDLLDEWPTGSVIAQAVHASVAAVWQSRSASHTLSYCDQPGNAHAGVNAASPQMHTVVLQAKSDAQLLNLADKLTAHSIGFVLWREQPEDFVTALAAHPYPQSAVKKLFSKFRLFK